MIKLLLQSSREDLQRSIRVVQGQTITFGASPMADYPLSSGGLDEMHCQLTLLRSGCFLECLSAQGTVEVNGRPVNRTRLKDEDRLRLGAIEFVLAIEDRAETERRLADESEIRNADDRDDRPSDREPLPNRRPNLATPPEVSPLPPEVESPTAESATVAEHEPIEPSANVPTSREGGPSGNPSTVSEQAFERDEQALDDDRSGRMGVSPNAQEARWERTEAAADDRSEMSRVPSDVSGSSAERAARTGDDRPANEPSAENPATTTPSGTSDGHAGFPTDGSAAGPTAGIHWVARLANNGVVWRYASESGGHGSVERLFRDNRLFQVEFGNRGFEVRERTEGKDRESSATGSGVFIVDPQNAEFVYDLIVRHRARFQHFATLSAFLCFAPPPLAQKFLGELGGVLIVDEGGFLEMLSLLDPPEWQVAFGSQVAE